MPIRPIFPSRRFLFGPRSTWHREYRFHKKGMGRKRKPCVFETVIFESANGRTIMLGHRTRAGRLVSWRVYSPKSAFTMGRELIEFAEKSGQLDWQDYEKEDEE